MFAIENPSTGKSEDKFERIDDSQRDDILDRSTAAYDAWRSTRIEERAAVLSRAADLYEERIDELADHIGREMGKLTRWAKAEVQIVADIYRYYAEHAHELLADEYLPAQNAHKTVVRKEPIGPLLGIMPWNFPYYQVARFAAPALMAGNVVLVKHAEICPRSAQQIQDILDEAGFPKGAYTNIFATHDQIAKLIEDPRVQGVSLTGSERAGRAIAAQAGQNLKKCVLELGGTDAYVVLDAADVKEAAKTAWDKRMSNTGQACTSNKRMIVMDDIYDEFVAELVALSKAYVPGDPTNPQTGDKQEYYPLSSRDAAETLEKQVKTAVDAGAKLHTGGSLEGEGAYFPPTVITDIPVGSDSYYEEFFGPVAEVYRVSSEEEAIELANNSRYGLGGAVMSEDEERAKKVAGRIDTGMIHVNIPQARGAELPFGGVKNSGLGRELGPLGMDEFVNVQRFFVAK